MRKTLCAIAIAAASAGQALAADLPARPEQPRDVYTPQYVWSGFYIGGYGGGQWAKITDDSGAAAASASGWLVGGIVGGNFQIDRFVFGVEADYGGGNTSGGNSPGGIIEKGDNRAMWDIRGRVGMAFDRILVFGAAGVSFAQPAITHLGVTSKQWANGWTAGGGVDYGLATNWVLRAEYLYSSYQAETFNFTVVDSHTVKIKSLNTLRGAVLIKF